MRSEMESAEAEQQQKGKEEFFRGVGMLKRFGIYDGGCPKCAQVVIQKNHCQGRERTDDLTALCLVLGGHLHSKCGTCNYVWLEHAKDDDMDRDWRGGLRFDEMLVDGVLVEVPVASAGEQWGVQADVNSDVPLVAEE